MTTLEQQRRASGARMESSRRASGAALESSRRASGAAIEAERRGADIAEDMQRIGAPERQPRRLTFVPPAGGVPATTGRGSYTPPASGTGGGIASPLTEKTATVDGKTVPDREYWPSGLKSSDGLFVLPAIKTLNLTDANGAAVKIQLANPEGAA
ncbi:hypothetical protein KRX52_04490 [Pseudomonas sp. MAP12]|uniref:Uncharacterized protein n=1 Tax=Geopseudomonas aromaticivorans TaxID=2849492 RepID=A0ABS6MTI1_9GAMM|nr:hypothetical protein [Pseudomonas aromaticivorans]MBV2132055.1 hypothetical protein [Pseudomonas aromaticivorans]